MNRLNSVLLAVVAAAAVTGAGYYVATDRADRQAAERAIAQAEQRADAALQVRLERECRQNIAEWDAIDRDRLRDTYGEYAEDVVEDCRMMIPIWEANPPAL